jgi:hypothetical protein
MTINKIIYLLSFLFILNGCFQEDDIIQREKIPEGVKIGNVELTKNYKYQVYYDLESNTALKSNHIKDWDLGFDCADSTYYVILNYAMMGAVYNSQDTDFVSITEVPSINDKKWKWDAYNGDLTKSALRKWFKEDKAIVSKKYVYIYDRGIDENGNNRGHAKFQIIEFKDNAFYVRFGDMQNTKERFVKIPKLENRVFNYLSFQGNGEVLDLEPPKDTWDLLFSRYREYLPLDDGSDTLQYTVVGAYLSHYNTSAIKFDSNITFGDIEENLLNNYQLSPALNSIGHNWKKYDIDQSLYSIIPERYYLIKTSSERYYKLQFLSYFNNLGERGYPQFEFQRIK